ncbi:MAG: hypothetical protein NZ742_05925, partial [Acidobacteria bacterium]|nr:hypothetical protein [Acidobacteriota bacterium]MDW7984409.1 alpha-2-macroglobulin family protein [Acidobacteriota bacterium]
TNVEQPWDYRPLAVRHSSFEEEAARWPVTVQVVATDPQGRRAEKTVYLWQSAGEEALLLRTDRAVARVGDVLGLDILATPARSTFAFVDAIVHGQTVLTKTVDLPDGRGRWTLPLTPELAGTLVLNAYRITAGGDIVRDTRVVFVEPANDLRLNVTADKTTYRPGEPARVRLAVTDPAGRPTVAALGLTVIDESVFALAELQPGLERLYFALEEELLKPRYEVHGWDLRPLLLSPEGPASGPSQGLGPGTRDRVVRVLLAATAPTPTYTLRVSTYDQRKRQVEARWRQGMEAAAEKVWKALKAYRRAKGRYPSVETALLELVAAGFLTSADIRDPLGHPYRIRIPYTYKDFSHGFYIISAGFDGRFDTADDLETHGGDIAVFLRAFGADREEAIAAAPTAAVPSAQAPSAPSREVRIRQFFPETLFVQPQLITNEQGRAEVDIPLADSITTWRLTALASSAVGQVGSTTAPIRVFQAFFVDIDLPVAFTQGDEVALPVAVYNYLDRSQRVRLRLDPGEGFDLQDVAEKVVTVQAHEVTAVRFRLRAARLGTHAVTIHAHGEAMSDAVRRTVTVWPDGKEVWQTLSDALTGPADRSLKVRFPADSIEGAHTLWVRVYPSAFTQVLDGLENLLRLPFGCFEQTSSVTYPNVLVLSYLRHTGQAQPETEMKARHFITIGYQRLLTFEVPGGGFSWFGAPPAHQVLTAYGLLEFADMRRVHDVDPALLDRTVQWLVGKQQPDGSWEPDREGIQEGAVNRQRDRLRTTAYISWALSEVGVRDVEPARAALQKAVRYLQKHVDEADDGYALAVTLNALLGARANGLSVDAPFIDRVARKLAGLAREAPDVAFWESRGETPFCGRGTSGDLETTALAAYALLRHGIHLALTHKALTYLVRNKDAFGTWQTTQATIWALKAFLAAMEQQGTGAADGTLLVWVNGQRVAEWRLTPDTADVVRTVDASRSVRKGDNDVVLSFRGQGNLLYQVSSRFYLPWGSVPPPPEEPIQVQVRYDRSELQTRETVTCQVRVTNRRPMAAQMVIVDIGIPPGFEVLTDDLTALVEHERIQKFDLTPRQVIFYLDRIEGRQTVAWQFRLRAKLPVRAKTGPTVVYEYYAPQERGVAAPVRLAVRPVGQSSREE